MSFLDRLLGRAPRHQGTGAVAKERLKFVLEYDRARLSPGVLELIRDDIINSISRHIEIDRNDVEIKLESGGRLVAEIPIGRSSRPDSRDRDG